jgi:hypothetical protein
LVRDRKRIGNGRAISVARRATFHGRRHVSRPTRDDNDGRLREPFRWIYAFLDAARQRQIGKANRADYAEIQAVRYAASLGTLRTEEELVNALHGRYIDRYEAEKLKNEGGGRSAEEWARKRLTAFIKENGINAGRLNGSSGDGQSASDSG